MLASFLLGNRLGSVLDSTWPHCWNFAFFVPISELANKKMGKLHSKC